MKKPLCPHTLRYLADRIDQECQEAEEVLTTSKQDYESNTGGVRDLTLRRKIMAFELRVDFLKSRRRWLRGLATKAEKKAR